MQEANIVVAIVVPNTAICKSKLYLSIVCMPKLYKLTLFHDVWQLIYL